MKPKNIREMIHQLPRLQWACRRGMLELDVLLGNFLKTGYPELNDDEKCLFVKLLYTPDPELFVWLMETEEPDDPEMRQIVGMIRRHARANI